jgi:hypothetical protein
MFGNLTDRSPTSLLARISLGSKCVDSPMFLKMEHYSFRNYEAALLLAPQIDIQGRFSADEHPAIEPSGCERHATSHGRMGISSIQLPFGLKMLLVVYLGQQTMLQ